MKTHTIKTDSNGVAYFLTDWVFAPINEFHLRITKNLNRLGESLGRNAVYSIPEY